MRISLKNILLAAVAGTLAACGGGGGGTPAPTTVTGAAVKGVVRNANVVIRQFPANSLTASGQIGKGTTDNNGDYNVTLGADPADVSYNGGAVEITVSAKADGTTRVICDVNLPATTDDCGTGVAFGTEYNPGLGFVMTSRQESLNLNGSNTIHTTPVTTLIANRAARNLTTGRNAAQAIRAAVLEVNQLAGGIDVVRTRPVNLANPVAVNAASPQQVALAILGAAAQRRSPGAGAGNLQTAITSFVATFSPPGTVGTPTPVPVADYQNLITQADSVIAELSVATNVGTALDAADDLIEIAQQTGGSIITTVDPTVSLDAVANAKAFIADIRTIINDYGDAFDNNDLTPFGDEIDMLFAKGGVSDVAMINIFDSTLPRLTEEVQALRDSSDTTRNVVFSCQSSQKTVVLTKSGSNADLTVRAQGESCTDTVDLTTAFPVTPEENPGSIEAASVRVALSGTIQTTASSGVRIDIAPTSAGIVTSVNSSEPLAPCGQEQEDEGCDLTNIDKIAFDLVTTLTAKGQQEATNFVGTIGFTTVRCTTPACQSSVQTSGDPRGLVSRFLLAGAFTRGIRTSSLTVSFGLDEANARLIDPEVIGNQIDADTSVNLAALLANLTITFDLNVPSSGTPAIPRTTVIVALTPVGTQVIEGETKLLGTAVVTLQRNLAPFLVITSTATAQNPEFNQVAFTRPLAPLNPLLSLRNIGAEGPLMGDLFSGLSQVGTVSETSNGLVLVRYSDGSFESIN